MTIWESITPDHFASVEQRFDEWCDIHGIERHLWGAAAETADTRAMLRQGDTWQRNRPDRMVRFGNVSALVDVKTTTLKNGHTGNISIELRTLWAAEHEQPQWTIYAIWHDDAWWYMTPFDVFTNALWPCCEDCWNAALTHNWGALPAKCPERAGQYGSGDPFVVVSMAHAKPLLELKKRR